MTRSSVTLKSNLLIKIMISILLIQFNTLVASDFSGRLAQANLIAKIDFDAKLLTQINYFK